MKWKALRSCACCAREQYGFVLTLSLLHCLVDKFVVDEGVVVVHAAWIHALVVPLDVLRWYALTKVRFDGADTHVEELLHALAEPVASFGVCKVHDAHASLPEIPLPYISVRLLEQIAFLSRIFEHRTCLADVRISPDTDFVDESIIFHALDLTSRVGEALWIPNKVAPVESAQPKAVEMEYFDWYLGIRHLFNEVADGLLIVGSRK